MSRMPVPSEMAQPPLDSRSHEVLQHRIREDATAFMTADSISANGHGRRTAYRRTALVNWWRAVSIEALCVAVTVADRIGDTACAAGPGVGAGGGLMAFVPNIGGVIALIGPVLSHSVSGQGLDRLAFLLGIYAIIVVIDQLVLQPCADEADGAGAVVGVDPGSTGACLQPRHAVLGRAAGAADSCCHLRIPQAEGARYPHLRG